MRESDLGPYRLVRRIASGGMAEIFAARRVGEAGFVRPVAIKRLWPELGQHGEVRRLFQREAKLLAALNHPGVPQVLELGREGPHWYIAMELVEGRTLAELRSAAGETTPVPVDAALGVGRQLCAVLHHVHERRDGAGRPLGIVHCDVTPDNVLVTAEGIVKLVDFGVARSGADPEPPTRVRGTLAYMAPEQITGEPPDRRSDLFAVGALLYEMTTGRRLRQGSDVEVMTRAVEQDVPPPSAHRDDYPPELEELVMACLARDPDRRPPHARALSAKLASVGRAGGGVADGEAVAPWSLRCAQRALGGGDASC
ncbi:MAG: serine/threonine-protein kinase [Myxococcota bacterium]